MRRYLFWSALLLASVAVACHVPRPATKFLRQSAANLTPEMASLAPPAISIVTHLRAPESVLWDPEQDLYFISNTNGGLLEVDNNGFISRVHPDTMQVDLKWIESGRNGVTLDGPKGMAILGDTLYVSDIAGIRKFDRHTGAPQGLVVLPGSTLINDLTQDGHSIYASDTGLIPGPGTTLYSTGTGAIWKITNDRPERVAHGVQLDHPNGIDFVNGHVRAVTFRGAHVYELDGEKRVDLAEVPMGQLDGLVHLPDGSIVTTSWLGKDIFRGPPKGPFQTLMAGIGTPADIGYDAKRHRLMVPSAVANHVTFHVVQ